MLCAEGSLGLAGEELEGAPVPAALFDEADDCLRAGHPHQSLVAVGGVDEWNPSGTLVHRQLDVVSDRDRCGFLVGGEPGELLAESRLADGEVGGGEGKGQQLHLALLVAVGERRRRPQGVRLGVSLKTEALGQRAAAARVVDEERTHPAVDGQPRAGVGQVLGHPVLGVARGVGDHQSGAGVELEHVGRGPKEVPVVGRGRRAHVCSGVERRQQGELLAGLLLAGVRAAEAGEVGVLAGVAGRGGLAPGVGVAAGVEDEGLDRRATDQHPRECTEADVERRAVAADGQHHRHEGQFLRAEVPPGQGGQLGVMDRRVILPGELEGCGTQRLHLGHQARDQTFVDADGQRLRVLEQAVDPRVEIRGERDGGGVDAGAAGGVGDHGGGRAVAGGAGLVQVQPVFEFCDGCLDPRPSRAVVGQGVEQGGESGQLVVEAAQVGGAAVASDPVGEGTDEVDRCDLAATAAGTVAAGHRVVVAAVQQDALDVSAGRRRFRCDPFGRVGQLREALEPGLEHAQQPIVLLGGGQGVRPAHLDALQAAGALPGVDHGREENPGATLCLLGCVEQGTGPRRRERGDSAEHCFQVGGAGARVG